jgi:hypothetical protein
MTRQSTAPKIREPRDTRNTRKTAASNTRESSVPAGPLARHLHRLAVPLKTAWRGVPAIMMVALTAWCVDGHAKAYVEGNRVVIAGANNTASTVARDIGDPTIFRHDPGLGRAVTTRNLLVKGEFDLGAEEEWDGLLKHALVLEIDVSECGSARIDVARGSDGTGHLRLVRTKITATHREKDLDECTEANVLCVAGKLTAIESTITGNINVRYEEGAEAELEGSTVSFTRASGMELAGVSARSFRASDTSSVDNALYGLSVSRLLSSPLELARMVFRGLAADVFVGDKAEVALTDSDFKTVRFAGRSGSLCRRWTVTVHLPRAGAEVVAESMPGTGGREQVRAVAGADKTCKLLLTEYVGTPEQPLPVAGKNKLTPHELTAYEEPGGRPLYRLAGLHVFMRGQEVRFP